MNPYAKTFKTTYRTSRKGELLCTITPTLGTVLKHQASLVATAAAGLAFIVYGSKVAFGIFEDIMTSDTIPEDNS